MEHLYFIFQNIWNRIGNVRPPDSARYRGRGVIWILPLLIIALFFISISHAEVKAKEEVSKDDAAKSQAQVTYGNLPLYFIQNDGQLDGKVKFYEKGNGHTTFFTKEGVYLSLVAGGRTDRPSGLSTQPEKQSQETLHSTDDSGVTDSGVQRLQSLQEGESFHPVIAVSRSPEQSEGEAKQPSSHIPSLLVGEGEGGGNLTSELIKLTFLDANPNPEIVAEGVQKGKVNYFIGNDSKKWRTNIPTHQVVIYKEVYPGIDIKFYGNNCQMEYDIIVKPGADPSRVRFAYEGIKGLNVTEEGDMEISLKDGKIIQKKPIIYQEIDENRVAVDGRFVIGKDVAADFSLRSHGDIASPEDTKQSQMLPSPLMGEGRVGVTPDIIPPPLLKGGQGGLTPQFTYTFEVAAYDRDHALIIDPVLVYSTYLGGSWDDFGSDIAVDAAGNAYIMGWAVSENFPATLGAYDTTHNGGWWDEFIVKLDASGSSLVYATYLGGDDYDYGHSIAVDAVGDLYITGATWSTNFPTTTGAYDTTYNGNGDVFVVKLNPDGSALLYSTLIGGSNKDEDGGIAVDGSGNGYVTGYTNSTDFPTTPGAYDVTPNGGDDVFVLKINSTGTALSYSTLIGGSGADGTGYGIGVDVSGNVYITGGTFSTDFPTTPGAYDTTFNGVEDAFVAKLNSTGSALSYATYIGGTNSDIGLGIAVDSSGNAYVTGYTNSTDFPTTPGAYDTTYNGIYDGFVVKLDASGSVLSDSTYIGGSNGDYVGKIALDASRNAYVIGRTESSDFPVTTGAYDTTPNGMSDVFVAKITFGNPTITYNPTTDFSIYNGNPNSVWSYGWMPNDFSTFNLYTGSRMDTNYNGSPEWYRYEDNYLYTPNIVRNDDNVSHYNVAPGQLALHPSSTNQPSVLRWTAPSTGLYNFAGRFLSGDLGIMQVGIRQGSNWLWQGVDSGSFNFDRSLTAGQSIDFLVYGGFWAGSTPLELTITASDTATSPSILFSDDFNDNYIDPTKWEYDRNRVLESDGIMKVETTVTDGGGRLWSKWIDISSNNTITITRKANLHYSNNYFNGTLRMLFDTNNDGIPDIGFGVEYANDLYAIGQYCPRYGFYIIRNSFGWYDGSYLCSKGSDISESIEPVWNTWFDEKIIYNSSTGVLEYFINGQKKTELNVGILPPADFYKMQLGFQAWGWWTGHYQYFDDIVVSQGGSLLNTYYLDSDNDTYGNPSLTTQACIQPSGYVSNSTDCNDTNASINPGAVEVCNGVDDNCNGQTDEGVQNTYYRDADSDTYGNASVTTQACTQPLGYVPNSTDCNDGNASIKPNATEVCNTIDDNCNGQVDEGCPGVEVCDGIDNDGDSLIDEDFPAGNTSCGSDVQVTPDDVTFTFPSVTLSGDTTVTTSGTGTPPPSGFKLGATPTYYEITSTATFSGTVEICINYDETQFATERNLKLFHWEGSGWKNITTSIDAVANIICGETTSFSPFIVVEELSTAVTLQNISAHRDGNQVILSWSTSFEIDNEGFIILRAESPGGPFTPITQGMIPAMGGGFKATYIFTDGNVEQGKTYYYRLQDIDSRGRITAHQVIPATVNVARKGETPQGTTGQEDNTASISQQSGKISDKNSVENDIYQSGSSPAWLSVVMSDNAGKSSGVETDPAMSPTEGATTAKEVYTGNASRDAKEAIGNIETHKQSIMEREGNEIEPQNLSPGTSTFSVSIEDNKGNIIVVSKIEDTAGTATQTNGSGFTNESGQDRQAGGQSDRPEGLSLQVKEESGRIVLTWQGRGGLKGFILHRAEKGKDNYTPISNLIPYFGRDDKDIFLYRFTDNSAKPGVKYDYRIEKVEGDDNGGSKIGKLAN